MIGSTHRALHGTWKVIHRNSNKRMSKRHVWEQLNSNQRTRERTNERTGAYKRNPEMMSSAFIVTRTHEQEKAERPITKNGIKKIAPSSSSKTVLWARRIFDSGFSLAYFDYDANGEYFANFRKKKVWQRWRWRWHWQWQDSSRIVQICIGIWWCIYGTTPLSVNMYGITKWYLKSIKKK